MNRIVPIILLGPWLLLFPFLLWMEMDKLHLDDTWSLGREGRKRYYLKVAMPGLEDDYFELLARTAEHFQGHRHPYGIAVRDDLPPFVKLMCENYVIYYLSPSRPTKDAGKMSFKLYYRKAPAVQEGSVIDTIAGPYPSHILQVK